MPSRPKGRFTLSHDYDPTRCPCGSGIAGDACCIPALKNQVIPSTCRALVRTRFTAFVRRDAEYLLKTWHPETRPQKDVVCQQWTKWVELEIIDSSDGQITDQVGTVTFRARFIDGAWLRSFNEKSRFERHGNHWLYVDGVHFKDPYQARKIERNSPCPCGSGKKFKKCCAL